jgi:asparagine synthase (glutamine-hydrolysing)
MLLTDDAGAWFLLREGQIEYVFEEDSPVLRLLRRLETSASLGGALEAIGSDLDDVRSQLDELFGQRLLGWAS